jgi:hypothetical protein
MGIFNFLINFIKERVFELQGGIFEKTANILLGLLTMLIIIWYFQQTEKRLKRLEKIMNQINEDLHDFINWVKRKI